MSDRHETVGRSTARGRRTIVTNVIMLALSTVVGLALVEGLLVFLVPAPIVWREPQESYQYDPTVGHKLVPGQRSFTHSFPVVTNSYGMRDREFSAEPSPDIVRILCLGDSLTFGDGVAVEDTYPKQLEALLSQEGTINYEVINAGVPSYDTWQEVAYFKERGVRLKPNTVVIGFYANDVVPKPAVVSAYLSERGTLRRKGLGGLFSDSAVYALKSSRLLLLLRDRIGKLNNRVNPSPEFSRQQSMLEGMEDDFIERGWLEVDASLATMASLKNEHGFDLLLVVFPMAEQILREYPSARYQTRLQEIAAKHGIPSIDLMDSFKREFNGFGSLFIEWDGHPGPYAHRIAAEQIAFFIRNRSMSGG